MSNKSLCVQYNPLQCWGRTGSCLTWECGCQEGDSASLLGAKRGLCSVKLHFLGFTGMHGPESLKNPAVGSRAWGSQAGAPQCPTAPHNEWQVTIERAAMVKAAMVKAVTAALVTRATSVGHGQQGEATSWAHGGESRNSWCSS